jgi:ATP-dependent DNA ligase
MAQGYEGGVLKAPESGYYLDEERRPLWLKVKPTETADLVVYDWQEGKNRLKGTVGALKVRGQVTYGKQTYDVDTEVGTGLGDKDRAEFKRRVENGTLAGTVVEVVFQSPSDLALSSKAEKKSSTKLDFARFISIREDKTK